MCPGRVGEAMLALGVEGTAHTIAVGIVRGEPGRRPEILASEGDMLRPAAGGIHPREAANHHAALGPEVLSRALAAAGVRPAELDLVAFSQGPGLGPCLRTAATIARAFALAAGKPILGVNHCVAHLEIGSGTIDAKDPVLLYASGGNTQVIAFSGGRYRVFGETVDIGVGNMLDKFAREEGHPFPGGPEIEKLAARGRHLLDLPYSVKGMDMAFSGMMTAARAHRAKGAPMEDVCFSLQETAFAMLVEVTERALAHAEKSEVVLGGGVACNERLWQMTQRMCVERGAVAYRPEKRLLVDNGAMIAWLGILEHAAGTRQTLAETKVDQRQRTDDIMVTWRRDEPRAFAGAAGGRYRGAESTVEPATLFGRPAIRKARAAKGYRLPALDAALRASRTRAEARLLAQARRAGVRTPLVYAIEGDALLLERLPGAQLKEALRREPARAPAWLAATGAAVAKLHAKGITHGDLTTSNVLVEGDDVSLVDFGLAALNAEDEDMGGDLHVMREALEATHADLPGAFADVLRGYREAGGNAAVEKKLEEITRRGRYRGT
ncbi:MAG: bifunctional N6-L-threonylcarbamoyladenine synthase / protein kinase Bud32 [Thermoplasmata archaeon]|jgi:N6-L-threonylcarbamoyladenine synthase/protein kinase Bud32|nr:bifunctional N6-L-threonylcarbamoyladenine synthase / protein kinase Bud32 [Thermoplasmata archaeon]